MMTVMMDNNDNNDNYQGDEYIIYIDIQTIYNI